MRSNSAAAAAGMRGKGSSNARRGAGKARGGGGGGKVGDSREAAVAFGGTGDFGAPEADVRERNYASTAARNQDPGGVPGHSVGEGTRDTGVGGNDSGVGASSGGDIDVDVVGVGVGGTGLSAGGPDERTDGADMVSSADNPSDANAARNPGDDGRRNRPRPAMRRRVEGTTIDRSGGDRDTTHSGRGSASVNGPADMRNDDSFASEISNDEASGADNADSDRM